MSVLEYGPKSLFKLLTYSIVRDGLLVGEIDCSFLGEQATITIGGASYFATRDDSTSNGGFYLEAYGHRVADGQKPDPTRLFTVQVGAKNFTLKAASMFDSAFVLIENGDEVGSIPPKGLYSAKSLVDLRDDLGLEVKAFMMWLVIIIGRRRQTFLGAFSGASRASAKKAYTHKFAMSALPQKADIVHGGGNVRCVPKADSCSAAESYWITSSANAHRAYIDAVPVTDVDPTAPPSAA